ncbi:MAG: lysophospholipid acyltransferase family protein [Acutalibacteraceae bacterium]
MEELLEQQDEQQNSAVNPDEHVLHMWTPFTLKLHKGYDYLSRSLPYRVLYVLLRALAVTVFSVLDPLLFGFRIRGRENLRGIKGAVTLCNHIHPLDCTMVGLSVPLRRQYFMTLQSNLEIPLIRHLVKGLGGVPIPRERLYTRDFSAALKEALQDGRIVHVYPEGVLRPYWEGLRKFRRGAFSLAYDANVPLVPMVIVYRRPIGLRALFRKAPLMELRILPPIYPDKSQPKRQQVDFLLKDCRDKMQAAIDEHASKNG